ncbi:MAG TPA: 2-succinyl-6-hydroxy-2,4-cyclohexadiene-1-carboxylate synthase [Ignavibacteriaceae bacterium]|nr:2-succinyl-6-hydroxy-2,4-cyclohexadiene-1-carboxylate synthase [Ignavibacteriaceae bacterium]
MIFEHSGLKFNIEFFHTVENDKPFLLFLHGFTGSTDDWKPIVPHINQDFTSAGIDLIGHGKTSSPDNIEFYSADAIANQLSGIIEYLIKRKVIIIGYSMGGRATLSFAAKYPKMIEALILESTTPGIKDLKQRKERVKKDQEIASYIETHSLEKFADYWMDLELFNTQRRFSEEKRKQIKFARMRNNPAGLKNSLLGFGTGTMPSLFNELKKIKSKTLLITGGLDTKFTDINRNAVKLFPNAQHKIIKTAGHNTHLEEPKSFIETINKFLKSL